MLTAGCGLHASPIESEQNPCAGEMAERLKAHAWKACIRETVSGVRIPLSPPFFKTANKNAGLTSLSTRCDQFLENSAWFSSDVSISRKRKPCHVTSTSVSN